MVQARSPPRAASTLMLMKKRGGGEPRHQRGILDRVPEPPAAPAQLIIGPIASGGDAKGQHDPRRQHPGPHRAGDGRSNLAPDQAADGDAEGDRQADITDVERGRVEGETGILKQRVKAAPVDRSRVQSLERIGCHQQEREKPQRERGLRPQARPQCRLLQPAREQCQHRPGDGENHHPQQHRPFVIAPCAGEFVEPRLGLWLFSATRSTLMSLRGRERSARRRRTA